MSEITHVPSDLLASPTFQLERLRRRTRDFVETALAKQGFNLRQYWALTCLVDGDASSQAALGDILHIDRSDMVRLVDSLEEHALAERMREAIAGLRIEAEGGIIEPTASFGCATLDEGGGSIDALIKRADERLYAAKRAGRNQVYRPQAEAA